MAEEVLALSIVDTDEYGLYEFPSSSPHPGTYIVARGSDPSVNLVHCTSLLLGGAAMEEQWIADRTTLRTLPRTRTPPWPVS